MTKANHSVRSAEGESEERPNCGHIGIAQLFRRIGTNRTVRRLWIVCLMGSGCATYSPLPPHAFLHEPPRVPQLPPPPQPAALPTPPTPRDPQQGQKAIPPEPKTTPEGSQLSGRPEDTPLTLSEVLESVAAAFPLLYAIEQERQIAAGQQLAAEGQFDPIIRFRAADQSGTFASSRLAGGIEQATPWSGITAFAGWRWGVGNFPIYYGDRKTADGGEFQASVTIPLLQNRSIDPRRARLRAAQIAAQAADPAIRRARLDIFRAAVQAYWFWQAAGAQYRVADELLRLAADRQTIFDIQFAAGKIDEIVVTLNRRLVAARAEAVLAAERNLQQAALRLSLYLRDENGNPVVPPSSWLIVRFIDLDVPEPDVRQLANDVLLALTQRPELLRFQLEKERRAVEMQLAANQLLPVVNVTATAAQDVGGAKKTFTGDGPFRTDRTNAEIGAVFEMPFPFRNARGQLLTAQAQLAQLLAQERYARDEITAQVQDAVSELVLGYQRLRQAREELRQARRVLDLETSRFALGRITLLELNLQEIAAAEAQAKVAGVLGAYLSSIAAYQVALGIESLAERGGAVLPQVQPRPPAAPEVLPPPRPVTPDTK